MAKVALLKSLNEYLLLLAGDVAEKLVRLKLNDYNNNRGSTPPSNPFGDQYYINVEGDGRIKNRVCDILRKAGALISYTSFRPQSPYSYGTSRKEPMRYVGKINEDWFNKVASTFAIAPKFETAGVITTKKNTWSDDTEKKTVTELQNYKRLSSYNSFTDAEYIYIWFHLDEYDVQEQSEKGTTNRHTSHGFEKETIKYKTIYPKALLKDLSIGVFIGHAEDYVEKHIEWGMKHLLGLKNVIINSGVETFIEPRTEITEFKDWAEEFILTQINRAEDIQTHLSACKLSYGLIQDAVEKYGGWDKFREDSKKEFVKYLEEYYPLHIGDDEPDEDLRKLCESVSEGKHKGFSERLQALEAGGSQCTQSHVETQ